MGGSLHLSAPWTPGGLASGIWAPLGVSAGGGARSGVGARARVGEGEMPWLATHRAWRPTPSRERWSLSLHLLAVGSEMPAPSSQCRGQGAGVDGVV